MENSRSATSNIGIVCSEQGELSHLVTSFLLGGALGGSIKLGSSSLRNLAIMRGWSDKGALVFRSAPDD
eukprot:9091641-Heterocapsa_arctica.AAC.1